MKVKVTEECIGCGACVDVCPEVFFMGDDGLAHIREGPAADPALADKIRDASASCPTEAIPIEG